jgi:hypothetical protein
VVAKRPINEMLGVIGVGGKPCRLGLAPVNLILTLDQGRVVVELEDVAECLG